NFRRGPIPGRLWRPVSPPLRRSMSTSTNWHAGNPPNGCTSFPGSPRAAMPNNQNRTGRAKRRRRYDGPVFIQLFRYMLNCPAYVSLSPWARAALIEVIRGYDGSNNGRIVLSVRALADRLACNKDTADHALQELTNKGFIEPRIKGAFSRKFPHATEWRLNDRRCDATGVLQSQAFLKWRGPAGQPPAKSKKRAYTNGPNGPKETDTVAKL